MHHNDDDHNQGRVAVPMFLSVFFIILILSVVRSCNGADTKPITEPLENAKAELVTKLKAARTKLIDNLKREEKAAQTGGKLDLTLAIRARLAELENTVENPFEKSEAVESQPVPGSMAEKLYLAETTAASTVLAKKVEAGLAQLEAKKIAATKAGKIDDALAIDDVMAQLASVMGVANKGIPMAMKGWAVVELRQPLNTPVVTLKEGSSRVMNFQESYYEVPVDMLGLKYNQIRFGQGQHPALKCIQSGKIYVLIREEETVKAVKAVKQAFTIKSGAGEVHNVYAMNVTAGQTVLFKNEAIVFAAEMEVKTK